MFFSHFDVMCIKPAEKVRQYFSSSSSEKVKKKKLFSSLSLFAKTVLFLLSFLSLLSPPFFQFCLCVSVVCKSGSVPLKREKKRNNEKNEQKSKVKMT